MTDLWFTPLLEVAERAARAEDACAKVLCEVTDNDENYSYTEAVEEYDRAIRKLQELTGLSNFKRALGELKEAAELLERSRLGIKVLKTVLSKAGLSGGAEVSDELLQDLVAFHLRLSSKETQDDE